MKIKIVIEANFDAERGMLHNLSATLSSPGRGSGVPLKGGPTVLNMKRYRRLIAATFDLQRAVDDYHFPNKQKLQALRKLR